MQSTDKQKLKRQLEQQAKQISNLDDISLLQSLLSTCGALMRMSEHIINHVSINHISDEVYANYLSFSKRIQYFYENHATINKEYTEMIQKELQKIEERKKVNDDLLLELTKRKEELSTLEEKQKKMIEERENVQQDIKRVEEEIELIPKEIKQLREKYKELEGLLYELQNAQVECSLEKQKELQEKIVWLTPIVEENKVATEILTNRIEDLEQQNTSYDKSRQVLSTNVVEIIHSSLDELKQVLKEYEGFLKETEDTANSLAQNLMACQQKREEYKNWFEVVETPLEAMIKGLHYPENESLRETLDIHQLPIVKKKMQDIHQNLMQLDQILASCAKASQKDLQRLKQRANP